MILSIRCDVGSHADIGSYESGGEFWFYVYRRSMTALVAANITLLGYFIIKEVNLCCAKG
jgi:hypothetical protein